MQAAAEAAAPVTMTPALFWLVEPVGGDAPVVFVDPPSAPAGAVAGGSIGGAPAGADGTVSNDIFRTVVRDGDSAHTVWAKITGLFTDNKIQRVTFLQQEFFGTHQNDLSLDDYALKLKSLSDELRDLEFPIDDKIMLSTLSAGLGEDLSNAASNLTLLTTPTFEQAVAYLRLEERRLKHLRARAAHTAFAAGFSRGAQTPRPRLRHVIRLRRIDNFLCSMPHY
ncbi:hypothetical protein QYE76_069240 [Lolium multiflorum]|uniref:Uncharacterized protein n=1 Tax=Lolium multiflorum TaxID=4521 RepID=A0AAD8SI78_LOLMU|nr:hypothetical protein QYE76_069240 [Lolium multiflorum]